jgi:phosphohistidine swiveling domain-containing protein
MINVDYIQKENYLRAFSFKNLGCLFIDLACSWYKKRNFLAIYQDGMCDQYFDKAVVEKTLIEGKELFSDEVKFKLFEAGFRAGIQETTLYLESIKNLTQVSVEDINRLRNLAIKMFSYFEKTEFLFTDACYMGEMSELLKKNLLVLGDDLKMTARPLMVELLTTVAYRLTELVAIERNLNPEDLKSYTVDEVIVLIETGRPVDALVISERKRSFVIYCKDETLFFMDGEDKKLVLSRFKADDVSELSEFKGVVASKGKVTARARVIIPELDQPYDLFVKKLLSIDMNQGEILVTETTSPDFVPLMKKAGGIIANQGGLNSHAAIMSRELKVPCLVGTYKATEILHTGDLIELDANNGMVRIIEKA